MQPPPQRLIRPLDKKFLEVLVKSQRDFPSGPYLPLVGNIPDETPETFVPSLAKSYMIEAIGGNHNREATRVNKEEFPDVTHYQSRLTIVYAGLSNEEAGRLATLHNLTGHLSHDMTFSETVSLFKLL